MNDIEKIIRGFQIHAARESNKGLVKASVSLSGIAESIGKTRDHFYKLFSGAYVLSKEDKEKLNELFKKHDYGEYIN